MKKTFLLFLSLALWFLGFSQKPKRIIEHEGKLTDKYEYEFRMLRNPYTGEIPKDIRRLELQYVTSVRSGLQREKKSVSFVWSNRGPWNVGGRTRALAMDVTDTSVIFAAGVSGGLWKSTDGGSSWIKIPMPDVAHSMAITCIAQDPRSGHTNLWYYGTGELLGNSASGGGAAYRGNGLFRSTDGGNTWEQVIGPNGVTTFNSYWNYVWDVKVSPVNGNVLVATYGGVYLSTDTGSTFNIVLNSYSSGNYSPYTDVEYASNGVAYAVLSYEGDVHGVFKSTDGGNTWTNITPATFPDNYKRVVIAAAPSDPNLVYFLGLLDSTDADGNAVHMLWVYNDSTGTWYDRSDNIPMLGGATGNFDSQGGYDLVIKVKPDDPDVVFIGGTNLFRSMTGFASLDTLHCWVGGYTPLNNSYAKYTNHHPDQHSLVFNPLNPKELISGHDGGLSKTYNCLDTTRNSNNETIDWQTLNNGYLTTQAYAVTLDPTGADQYALMAGFQDNGSWFTDSNDPTVDWEEIGSGDGGYCWIADTNKTYYHESQNGHIFADFWDDAGNYLGWTRVYPTLSSPLFVEPFVVDPNTDNIMYMIDGDNLWRLTDLQSLRNNIYSTSAPSGWELISSSLGVTFTNLAISKTPANILYLGTSSGEVYKVVGADTASSAADFQNVTSSDFPSGGYVSSIYVDPDNADSVFVTFSNYGVISVFFSPDGGKTWSDISGNLEENADGSGNGPSVRWITGMKYQGENYYFVGTSTGLYYTDYLNDTATVWTQLGASSIGYVVVDMVRARSNDGTIAVATHANGIYTGQISVSTNMVRSEPVSQQTLKLYPNPSNGLIKVAIPNKGHLVIYNNLGQKVYVANVSQGLKTIDLSILPAGVYYVWYYGKHMQNYAKLILVKN